MKGYNDKETCLGESFMFRLFCIVVFVTVGGTVFAQSTDVFQDLERSLDWDRFGVRSRSRFGSIIFSDVALDKLEAEIFRLPGRSRLGVDDVEANSRQREPEQRRIPPTAANPVPPANTPVPVNVAETPRVPIRRPTGFFQQPGVMEPNFVLDGPSTATPREQRWFREPGGRREGSSVGNPETGTGIGRGAVAIGGEEALRSPPNAETAPLRTPTLPSQNPEQARRRFEEKLEGMLLSDPNVHLLSPVRISFNGGIVTVRGVVPNQTHKVAAGNILLSDPAVKQVNNMISVVPLDPNQNPPPIEGR